MAKILIAEDEADIRDLISFTLQFSGHTVVATKDGQEALEMALQEMPDMILMDVRMPRMTGYDACRRIKEEPTISHIPVVFLSAKGQDVEIRAGLDAGATEYLLKPFAPYELVERVTQLLAQYGK
jgi:CheY-like chemotaxis protein